MNLDPAGTTFELPAADDAAAEEAALVARIAAGETRRYSLLVDRYQRRLWWSVFRMLGDPDETDDVVQEAFVRAYERIGDYDPAFRFYTWLYSIARNRCLNALRRRKTWRTVSLSDPDVAPPLALPDSADRPALEQELARAVAACRATLPAEQREVFDLRHDEEFSYAEIARAVEVPEGTVMSRLARAREKMRACLSEKGVTWP